MTINRDLADLAQDATEAIAAVKKDIPK